MRLAILALALVLPTLPVAAHEFWFEPEDYTIAPDGQIRARAINGENFFGIEYGYSEQGYRQSGIFAGDTRAAVTGTLGMKPAIQAAPLAEGLNVVYHASGAATLSYPTLAKFKIFLEGKRLEATLEEHAAKGFPKEDIREVYFRFVKTLVGVGSGAGSDRAVGMSYELVALTNPYTDNGDMRFRLLFRGAPEAGAPVFVFHKVGTEVEELKLRTDANGEVSVPRQPGAFMVNAVHISEPDTRIREVTRAHWQTLWAALTYEIGG
ncbi:DUF4198 domain-containing protein [Halovulum dunhuangense]|uniref:DUF4198 domain-containing protein n=1 Tax=Halovulum dunhuangense TaxID=1505036 RepID=A0A849KYG6_9RHOB|nr:DUF4198 domain-containing protein [Halovulum dunhuangense]NNU79206.1 DUF4198 domain-containing protein [Halovulum dunhuangense]